MAAHGAAVTGIDLGADLIESAKSAAAEVRLNIDFRTGDAEKLAFVDQTFDAVISTCGVMRRESLKRDFIAYHDGFKTELGVAMPRDYLVTIGIRK